MKILINNKEILNFKLLNFSIYSENFSHSVLKIEFLILSDINLEVNKKIIINNIFEGKIVEYSVSSYRVEIKAYSNTKELDIEKRSRIYQDENVTYKKIIDDVMKSYKLKYVVSKSLNRKINRMYFQDNVSDFEFLKRILTDIDEGIFNSYNGLIIFGYDNFSTNSLKYIEKKTITDKGIYYQIYNKTILPLDKIDNMYVVLSKIEYIKGIFLNTILVSSKKKISKKICSNVKGSFVEASVVELVSDNGIAKMKLDFSRSMGVDDSVNKRLFSFATPYSKTMTGLYVSPQVSDIVDVYFPSNDENDAKVAFCINNKNSERFLDETKRNYISDKILLEIEKGKLDINASEISLVSIKSFNLGSNSYLSMESKDETSIYADKVSIVSKKSDIELNSKKNILLKALNKIHNN